MKTRSALLSLVFAVFANMHVTVQAQVNEQDSLALVDLYNSTGGPNWDSHDNWLTGPIASWYGITTTATRVIYISLRSNNLTGNVPASIGNLSNLVTLDLGDNQLTSLPPEVGNLASLWTLSLWNNQLTSLPPGFCNLTSLVNLYLSGNQLTSLPPEFGNLANLRALELHSNQLTSLPPGFGNLAYLRTLWLLDNQLTSLPPEFGNLARLRNLYLSDNQLTSLPPQFGNLANLWTLYLSDNQLTSLPPEFGNLASLRHLYLYVNQLTSLPPEFGNLAGLRDLYLSSNQLTSLPPEFGNLPSLRTLDLSSNQLASLPPQFGNLASLKYLRLDENQLTSLPAEFGNLASLQFLLLNENQLTSLPPEFGNLAELNKLELSNNHFSFDLEKVFQNFPGIGFRYDPQANIALHQNGNTLSVSAGGTLSNNTYKWYRIGQGQGGHTSHIIIAGDSVFHPVHSGKYFCKITNSICTKLKLFTDTIDYAVPVMAAINSSNALVKIPGDKKVTLVYPNPARNILNIQTDGNTSFSLLDQSGKTWLSKSINSSGSMNVSGMAAGLYYLRNNSNGDVQKVIIAR